MRIGFGIFIFVFFLALQLSAQTGIRDYKIFETATGKEIDINDFVDKAMPFDVIFFGEFHDDSLIHLIEAQFLEEFFNKNPKTAVSMEMFERDGQELVEKYLNGEFTEEVFMDTCTLWPNYSTDYKPLVELAKKNNSYVIAANAPRKYAGIFSKGGMTALNKLSDDERKMFAKEINIENDQYQKEFYKTMLGTVGKEKIEDLTANEENTIYLFYGAQVLKDETMAESIVNYIKKNPGIKIIHYDGNFHSQMGLGTVQKVKDRDSKLKIGVISSIYVEKDSAIVFKDEYKNEGNFVLVLEQKPPDMDQNMMGGHMGGNFITNHEINIILDTKTHGISGSDKFSFSAPIAKTGSVKLLKDLKIESITTPEGDIFWKSKEIDGENEIIFRPGKNEITSIEIKFSGNVYHQAEDRNLKQRHAFSEGMISSADGEGIYLPAGSFYPYTDDDLANFNVKVTFPEEINAITSGVMKNSKTENGMITKEFVTELPTDNLTLVGGKYIIKDSIYDGKTFSVYLFEASRNADSYLNAMVEYYKYYTGLFGKYPYSNFTLVDNFFATGFGMPGYTLLSGRLLQMPWVVLAPGSLAHEFCHNWWGNSVYVNIKTGNWCEALTTFSSNYYYNVLVGKQQEAIDWRKKSLIAIEELPAEHNYPLEEFKYQRNSDDAVVGYSKGGFLFYEVYKLMGDEHFFGALKSFSEKYTGKRTSWFGMMYIFSGYAKKNKLDIPLMKVFNQWLKTKDVPTLKLNDTKFSDGKLSFEIKQDGKFYMIIPVKITTDSEILWKNCTITGDTNKIEYEINGNVKKVELDPEYQSLRKLNKWEIPYTFAQALNNNPLVILPKSGTKDYEVGQELVKMLNESGYTCDGKASDNVIESDWINRAVIVLGYEDINPFFVNLNGKYPDGVNINKNNVTVDGKEFAMDENLLMMNFSHPNDQSKSATVIGYTNLDNSEQFRRLFHYMSYSMLMVSKTKMGRPVVSKELYPDEPELNPMKWVNK